MTAYPPAPEPLDTPVLDSHCHLDISLGAEPAPDVPSAVAAAAAVGVTRLVHVGCDLPGARWAVDVAATTAAVVAAVALHPNEVPRVHALGRRALQDAWDELDALATNERVRAIGETGLDFFRTGEDGRAVQEESFRRHIALAKFHHKALVIHDRDAHTDVLRVLADEGPPDSVVFHCFSGDEAMARRCVQAGFVLSFAGTVTFSNAPGLRAALRVVPLDQLLVETDAPFLAPVPHRGRPNASYLVPLTLRVMARELGVGADELAAAVDRTGTRVFGEF